MHLNCTTDGNAVMTGLLTTPAKDWWNWTPTASSGKPTTGVQCFVMLTSACLVQQPPSVLTPKLLRQRSIAGFSTSAALSDNDMPTRGMWKNQSDQKNPFLHLHDNSL